MLLRQRLGEAAGGAIGNHASRSPGRQLGQGLHQTECERQFFTDETTAFIDDRQAVGVGVLAKADVEMTITDRRGDLREIFC